MKKLKSICKSIVLLLIVISISCSKPVSVKVETRDTESRTDKNTDRYNPLELPGDKEIIPGKYPVNKDLTGRQALITSNDIANQKNDTLTFIENSIPESIDSLNNQSYRVQIGTTKLFADARQMVSVAEEIFDRLVSVDYEVPYYKLRVGNFADRDDAEEYMQKAKAAGYRNAWVIMVIVNKKEASGIYDDLKLPINTIDTDTVEIDDSNDDY